MNFDEDSGYFSVARLVITADRFLLRLKGPQKTVVFKMVVYTTTVPIKASQLNT